MTEPILPIDPGTLWSRIENVTHHAKACGALETIETEARVVEEDGIPLCHVAHQVGSRYRMESGE